MRTVAEVHHPIVRHLHIPPRELYCLRDELFVCRTVGASCPGTPSGGMPWTQASIGAQKLVPRDRTTATSSASVRATNNQDVAGSRPAQGANLHGVRSCPPALPRPWRPSCRTRPLGGISPLERTASHPVPRTHSISGETHAPPGPSPHSQEYERSRGKQH